MGNNVSTSGTDPGVFNNSHFKRKVTATQCNTLSAIAVRKKKKKRNKSVPFYPKLEWGLYQGCPHKSSSGPNDAYMT